MSEPPIGENEPGEHAPGAVARGLATVRERILRAAERHSRDPEQIHLLAVSKRQPADKIRQAYAEGQRDFGENYAQELLAKHAELADLQDLRFHMIGHLQRNKVAALAGVVSAVHSVDSLRLVRELAERSAARPVPVTRRLRPGGELLVFIEVNLAGEAQKGGCSVAQLGELVQAVRAAPTLALGGLMAIPVGGGDPELSRREFTALERLRQEHGGSALLPELSMGMSRDLEVAVECGSSWVRVGTDIFGERV
jgi:pyridoxal phosphate enzyme (YggS family)